MLVRKRGKAEAQQPTMIWKFRKASRQMGNRMDPLSFRAGLSKKDIRLLILFPLTASRRLFRFQPRRRPMWGRFEGKGIRPLSSSPVLYVRWWSKSVWLSASILLYGSVDGNSSPKIYPYPPFTSIPTGAPYGSPKIPKGYSSPIKTVGYGHLQ